MKKSLYKSLLAMLMSAMVTTSIVSPLPVSAQTMSETDTSEGGTTEEEDNSTPETISSFRDENDVVYKWYGYADGTAEIYEMSCDKDTIVIDVPSNLEGYRVTRLSGKMRSRTIESVTLPETIEYLGYRVFEYSTIEKLYYNAADAKNDEDFFNTPFAYTTVKQVYFGESVERIADYTFYQTIFSQAELELHVPKIGKYAFHSASLQSLTLTNDVKVIVEMAFEQAKIQSVHYNCPDVEFEKVDDLMSSPFCGSVICQLDFSEDVQTVPDYCFAQAHFKMKEYTFEVERIGDYAFYGTWDSSGLWIGTDIIDKLTFADSVKYMGKEAFGGCYINELVLNATVECGATNNLEGVFYTTDIHKLTIGENVEKIPDYFFSNADFILEELEVCVPEIGTNSFYNVWYSYDSNTPKGILTVTDQVKVLGANAFAGNELEELYFESNATTGATDTLTGVFYDAEIYKLVIGEAVTMIQPYLFANADFKYMRSLSINVPIGTAAFYSAGSYNGGFLSVTIGEGVTSIGNYAFRYRSLGDLTYDAVNAETFVISTLESPFHYCTLSSLTIGDKVEKLDKGIFCGIRMQQDELCIPDSVREIGSYAFYNSSYLDEDLVFQTLRIGSGLRKLDYKAFAEMSFQDVYVEALSAEESYSSVIGASYNKYLPSCETLHMHHGSPFYTFFERNAVNVDLYCVDYLISSVGEEYFDSGTKQFVTPAYETCSVCGYKKTSMTYEKAFAVTFVANGVVVDTKYCKENGTVTAPEVPDLEGFEFTGWDSDFSEVTKDLTVSAIYTEIVTPEPVPECPEWLLPEASL